MNGSMKNIYLFVDSHCRCCNEHRREKGHRYGYDRNDEVKPSKGRPGDEKHCFCCNLHLDEKHCRFRGRYG